MWSRFKTLDPWLFTLPLLLMAISVLMIYFLNPDSTIYIRQLIYCGLGVIALGVAAFIDYRGLQAWSPWIYAGGLLGLLAVRFFGTTQFGAKLWINFGFFQFEPSELFKLIVLIMVAALLSSSREAGRLSRFLLAAAAGLLPIVAIILQPNLGTALVLLAEVVAVLLYANILPWQRILVISTLVLGVIAIGLCFHGVKPFTHILKPFQKARLTSFIDPKADPLKSGYNVEQSVIAVGSGGLTGTGLGNGSQSQLNFLPVAQADFIFAVIAENWGLVGSLGILGIYLFLILRVIQAGRIAKDQFGALICIAIATKLIFEVSVNIGMNIRLMPVTGIPLPFLSYGGTTLITNALAIGIVQSVALRYKRLTF